MATELRKLGAAVDSGTIALTVSPPPKLLPGDHRHLRRTHRIAMCFSLAALGGVAVRILDPQCVRKTFPSFFATFAQSHRERPRAAPAFPSSTSTGRRRRARARSPQGSPQRSAFICSTADRCIGSSR
jgi:3-phosphoshikimate 1-carboxyvinyltransferase